MLIYWITNQGLNTDPPINGSNNYVFEFTIVDVVLHLYYSKFTDWQHLTSWYHAWRYYCLLSGREDRGPREAGKMFRKLCHCYLTQPRCKKIQSEVTIWIKKSYSISKQSYRWWVFLHCWIRGLKLRVHAKKKFFFLNQNIRCGYSKESSQWDVFWAPKTYVKTDG